LPESNLNLNQGKTAQNFGQLGPRPGFTGHKPGFPTNAIAGQQPAGARPVSPTGGDHPDQLGQRRFRLGEKF
jgi:hypothetical protein